MFPLYCRKTAFTQLYVPHGLFDLEDVLLHNNSLYRSDAAINDFYNEMKNLNDNDYGWFGGYNDKFRNQFMDSVNDFLHELIYYNRSGGWSYDYRYKFSLKNIIKDLAKLILRKEVKKFGYRIDFKGNDGIVNHSIPTPEEFYKAANRFIERYFSMIGYEDDKVYVFDQIIEPWQLHRVSNYFDDKTKFIVFDRDPRDTFFRKNIYGRRHTHILLCLLMFIDLSISMFAYITLNKELMIAEF